MTSQQAAKQLTDVLHDNYPKALSWINEQIQESVNAGKSATYIRVEYWRIDKKNKCLEDFGIGSDVGVEYVANQIRKQGWNVVITFHAGFTWLIIKLP